MSQRERIKVPSRQINGGMDVKFESDPYYVKLYGIMTPEEYTVAIERINMFLKPSRSNIVDKTLLATGVLMVPLALWGIRHASQTKKRKRLLKRAIEDFNNNVQHSHLLMRWNRRPESFLSIERRVTNQNDNNISNDPNQTQMVPVETASNTHTRTTAAQSYEDSVATKKSVSPLDEIHDLT